jgi:tetratricopeptide (TPR) repeat protein
MLVFVDDLQWTDTASLDVLHYAIRRAAETGSGLLIVFTVRSEALPITPGLNDWLEHLRHDVNLQRIELKSLDERATHDWLASIGQHNHALETFATWLFEETQGQPLFIAQTLKNLLEQGVLKSHTSNGLDFSAVANGQVKPELAPGVREVIRARINRLSPSAFALLSAGAVLGQDLEFEMICQVAGLPESDGLTALDEVLSARLLLETGRYRFTHDKIRDVTYTEAGDARRKVFHRRALETLEHTKAPSETETQTLAKLEFLAVRAHHAFAANQWAKAFYYSVEAAAETPHSLDQVRLEHGLRARALLREPPEGFDPISEVNSDQRIELYTEMMSALEGLREFQQLEDMANEMLEYARRIGDDRLEIHGLLSVHDYSQADHGTLLLEQALIIAERIENRWDWIFVQNHLMTFDWMHWRHQAALERGQLVLPVARAHAESNLHDFKTIAPLIDCIRTMAQSQKWSGQWDEALSGYQEEEALVRPFPFHRLTNANCRFWQGALLLNIGRIEDGLELGRTGMETQFELTPDNPFNSVSSNWYSRALLELGHLSAGLEIATRGFDLTNRPKTDVFWRVGTYWNQAYALQLLGQLEQAFELTLVALEENEVLVKRNVWGIAGQEYLYSFVCSIHAMQGQWSQACEHAILSTEARFKIDAENAWNAPRLRRDLETEALLRGGEIELARKSVERLGEFTSHYVRRRIPYLRALSVLEVWDEKLELAIKHLEEARDLMIPIGLPNERWTLEAKLAELYERHGDLENSREARVNALEVIESLAEKIDDLEMRTTFLECSRAQML